MSATFKKSKRAGFEVGDEGLGSLGDSAFGGNVEGEEGGTGIVTPFKH